MSDKIERQDPPKEPWGYKVSNIYPNEIVLLNAENHWIVNMQFNGELLPKTQETIAERMTDCINSFAGIRSDWIKKYGRSIHASTVADLQNVSARLDMALEALKEIRDRNWVENCLDPQLSARIAAEAIARMELFHACDACGKLAAGPDECVCPECKRKAIT